MKYFHLKTFLEKVKFYLILLIVCAILSASIGISFSNLAAHAEINEIESIKVENNVNKPSNTEISDIKSLTQSMFGDVEIKSSEYLFNLDGVPDYIYVEFENSGYAVYYKDTLELLEYSAKDSLIYPNNQTYKYYGGPGKYFTKQGECFEDLINGEIFKISLNSAKSYSNDVRNMLTESCDKNNAQSSVKFDYNAIKNNNKIVKNESVDDFYMQSKSYGQNLVEDIPTYDEYPPIKVTDGNYISNYNYFLSRPLHGQNQTGTCGAVAAQLLLSYNNYYNDRRIIPDKYLNGGPSDPQKNPNLCSDPMLMTSYTLGTRGYYEDGRDDSNSYFKYIIKHIPVSTSTYQLKIGLEEILNERNDEIGELINCSVTYKYGSATNAVDASGIVSEIISGRPVLLGMQKDLGGRDHAIVAYGYQNYTYPNSTQSYLGYITHFGWKSGGSENVWVNSAWCYCYYALNITHTHNYYTVGAIGSTGRTEYKCRECGHRTDVKPDKVYLDISKVVKSDGKWNVTINNISDAEVTALYNGKMCFDTDAQNWTGLTDVSKITIPSRSSKVVTISGHLSANAIAVSYVKDGVRLITYANELTDSGGKRLRYSYITVPKHEHNGMTVRNVGKNVGKWLIELTNNTGATREFEYNAKLCFENDAKTWQGQSDQKTVTLQNGKSITLEIQENGTATSIAISYKKDLDRYIFYAYDLNAEGRLTSFGNVIYANYYERNGIKVAIDKKVDNTWHLLVINRTGMARKLEYNSKMCFEGDAQNWTGLNDVKETRTLQNGESQPITITENYSATSIAISYMETDGIYRKVFYANELDQGKRTMNAKSNTVDTTKTEECIAAGTLITLADGSQKAVEELTGDEMLLVWNLKTGTLDSAPIMFIDSDPTHTYNIINLHFSDETVVKVIYEHGFWDFDLNSYVYLDENAEQYIGHWFNKQTSDEYGNFAWEKVQLTEVTFTQEYTTAYSPVTYGHLCYFVNGMLSMPGGIEGLFNIFEVDKQTMTYDLQAMAADIEEYGLFTYEEFYEIYPISEEVFEAFNGEYLKVAIGKGLITYERIAELIERYSEFF